MALLNANSLQKVFIYPATGKVVPRASSLWMLTLTPWITLAGPEICVLLMRQSKVFSSHIHSTMLEGLQDSDFKGTGRFITVANSPLNVLKAICKSELLACCCHLMQQMWMQKTAREMR